MKILFPILMLLNFQSWSCASLFQGNETDLYLSFIEKTYEKGYLEYADISYLISKFEKGLTVNPLTWERISSRTSLSTLVILSKEFDLFSPENLNRERIIKELETYLKPFDVNFDIESSSKIHFVSVPPSYYINPQYNNQMATSYSFDFMTTLVSQELFTLIMGYNPSRFVDGLNSSRIESGDGGIIFMKPQHPLDNASFEEVLTFFQRLNRLSQSGEPDLLRFMVGHQPGDLYRLPYEVEWNLILSKGQLLKKTEGMESLTETMPINFNPSVLYDNSYVFDMGGNLSEFMMEVSSPMPSGNELNYKGALPMPSNIKGSQLRILTRGNSYQDGEKKAFSFHESLKRSYQMSNKKSSLVGFRMVRMRKNEKDYIEKEEKRGFWMKIRDALKRGRK